MQREEIDYHRNGDLGSIEEEKKEEEEVKVEVEETPEIIPPVVQNDG